MIQAWKLAESVGEPCLWECLGLVQIILTTPLRLMTRHLSHRGFTDAETFTFLYSRVYITDSFQVAVGFRTQGAFT